MNLPARFRENVGVFTIISIKTVSVVNIYVDGWMDGWTTNKQTNEKGKGFLGLLLKVININNTFFRVDY